MISIFCLLATSVYTPVAAAADIRPFISSSGSYRAIMIEGDIEPGDFDTFIRIVRENQGQVSNVYLYSPGGDFYESMKIGRAMRALELGSVVPMRSPSGQPICYEHLLGIKPHNDPQNCTCASACFFIHIGGIFRGGTFLAVHRPYFKKGKFGELAQDDAKKAFDALQDSARSYLQEMGVPKHIEEDLLGTASDSALILDDKTITTYFKGALPYRQEWEKNKCSRLSESETERAENYFQRLRQGNGPQLSLTESQDFDAIQKKKNEELDCAVNIESQSRVMAYEQYFGTKPNDSDGYNFLTWAGALKYLGKQFYDILSEENFTELKFGGSTELNRSPTAKAPTITLSDSDLKPKVVTWIGLTSSLNPSPEFIQRLVNSLEGAWGKPSGGNGTTVWQWDKKEFSAKLRHDTESPKGAYMSLVIKAK